MPVLQYECPFCKKEFDELVKNCNETVRCPVCGKEAKRSWSGKVDSATGKCPQRCGGNCKTCSGCH